MAAKPMTKTQVAAHFAQALDVPKKTAAAFLQELAALTSKEVKRTGVFVIPGICKVVRARRKARMGRNPATGQAIKIPAKTVLRIRPVKALKDTVLPSK